jgi:transposase-like protein
MAEGSGETAVSNRLICCRKAWSCGTSAKTVLTEDGPIRVEVPRDRDGSYEPILIPKHERRFTGFGKCEFVLVQSSRRR